MRNYSFLDTTLLVNGTEITGFDEGDDVITLERLEDSTTHRIGSDGEMTVSLSADRSGTITFRLMSTSESNKLMSALLLAQENSGVFAPMIVLFKDTRGLDIGAATKGYIARPATMVRGTSVNAQEWMITVERLDLLHGGEG